MTKQKKPVIGDTIKIICSTSYGQEEVVGKLQGYQSSMIGKYEIGENQYVKLKGYRAIYMPSITDWEILDKKEIRKFFFKSKVKYLKKILKKIYLNI